MANKPTFVGVGGMKCASTWVSECLREHPQVLLSKPKETAYFLTRTGLDDYLRYFSEGGGSEEGGQGYTAVGEFTPLYLPNASIVSKRIFETLGRVQILVTLRDPIKRYLSHYKWVIGRRPELERAEFVHLDLRTFARANSIEPRLLEFGHYCDDLRVYMDVFGADRVHVMLHEDISRDPLGQLRGVFGFLGVDPEFEPASLNERVREGYVPRSELLERAKVWGYFLLKDNAPWAIDQLKKLRLEVLLRRVNTAKSEPLRVAPEVEGALAEHYAEEVARMRELLGQPLPGWGKI